MAPEDLIIPLEYAASRPELAGGKASALGACIEAGLPVVPGVVVTTEAFRASASAAGLDAKNLRSGDVAGKIKCLQITERVRQSLERALETLRLPGTNGSDPLRPDLRVFAVRSSAVEEDGAKHSFAGQLESFLCVRREEVPAKVVAVWASAFSARVAAYRREHGIDSPPKPPAVLINPMVPAEVAGVAFSADPVTGRRRRAVVSAVWGLGLRLVSGESAADLWQIEREGTVAERVVARKPRAHRIAGISKSLEDKEEREEMEENGNAGPSGGPNDAPPAPRPGDLCEVEVDPVEAALPALSDPQAVAVARLARRCEDLFGVPQDIEWAISDGRIWLLQSRPITSLGDKPDPDAARILWDNSNIAESYNGVTTPLTFTFARRAYEHVYREFCRALRVPQARIEACERVFAGMIGFIRGRVYYNLPNWHRVLATLPGYTFNSRFMEQMMGVRSPLPERYRPAPSPDSGLAARWADLACLVLSGGSLLIRHINFRRLVKRFQARFNEALETGAVPLDRMDASELLFEYRRLEERLLTKWDAPILNDFYAMLFFGLLRQACAKWLPEKGEGVASHLIASDTPSAGAEPARLINEMGLLLSGRETLLALFRDAPAREALAVAATTAPDLAEALRDYLNRFGDRCFNELKLETPALAEDPTPLLRAVARAAAGNGKGNLSKTADLMRRSLEQEIFHQLRHWPLRRVILKYLLRQSRRHLQIREALRLERTRLFGRVRKIFNLLGARLAAAKKLPAASDIFFLTLEEVCGAVDGTSPQNDLAGVAAVRKAEFQRYLEIEPPPNRFETVGLPCGEFFVSPTSGKREATPVSVPEKISRTRAGRATLAKPNAGRADRDCLLIGIACSPGRVRAPARVIRDPLTDPLNHGEILVARHTDPGWVMLFPSAAGLLVERGSLLSHAAIVARELGLPTIVGIDGLLDRVKTGDMIELDGESGVARLLGCSLDGRPGR